MFDIVYREVFNRRSEKSLLARLRARGRPKKAGEGQTARPTTVAKSFGGTWRQRRFEGTYDTVGVSANCAIRGVWHNQWKSGWSRFLSLSRADTTYVQLIPQGQHRNTITQRRCNAFRDKELGTITFTRRSTGEFRSTVIRRS